MHPRSPGRRSARFPPLPLSLMALCNQLIPARQGEAALTRGRTPLVQPRWPHASPLHRGPPARPVHPQPGVQLGASLTLSFLGETMGEQGPQRHLGSPTPLTPPQPSKRQPDCQDTQCPLAMLPDTHRAEGLYGDTPRFSQSLTVPPRYPKSSSPPCPPACCRSLGTTGRGAAARLAGGGVLQAGVPTQGSGGGWWEQLPAAGSCWTDIYF